MRQLKHLLLAGPGHPAYGIDHSSFAPRLTPENWERSVLVRVDQDGWLLIYFERLFDSEIKAGEPWLFVRVRNRKDFVERYLREFSDLAEALAYANGEDGGALALESRPAARRQWPRERGLEW